MARILIHTFGSSGDVNPFFALALELRQRGHEVHFALAPTFAARAESLGFTATIVGPDPDYDSDLVRQMLTPGGDITRPVRLLFERVLIPSIGPATEVLEPLARDADLFLSHTIQLAAPIVAARTGVAWVSATPATVALPSGRTDVPNVALRGLPGALARLSWEAGALLFRDLDTRAAVEYRKLGAAPLRTVFAGGSYSRRLTLGLWSPTYFPRPSDWPAWMQVGGYARWDGSMPDMPPALDVPKGTGPLLVFTLGSSVVNDPRGYYEAAMEALAPTHWRAILLGAPADLPIPTSLQSRVTVVPFAPYADVFQLADVIVHQGGIGTTQAACYYGLPSVVVPRSFDQWENAAHIQRHGWGLRLRPQDFSPCALRYRLERLLADADIRTRVAALGQAMCAEPGPVHSADLLEETLR
jgi:rhamnosyltransferase subunit B